MTQLKDIPLMATPQQQMHGRLIRGMPEEMPPPVIWMDGLWSPREQAPVEAALRSYVAQARRD